jgi:predicted ATPase/class 3 adenylate cyclase
MIPADNPLPSGTVTFLFTDIEGSTRLWEKHPEAMSAALARHDTLLRLAIEQSGGFVFKTIGDAFCAAFATAPDAVEACLNAQRALQTEPWPEPIAVHVRMALHTGAAERRDGDYFGPPVNRVARLLSIGHGGQTLLSQPVYELVRDHLPPHTDLRDMETHRLKDLQRPEHVYQLLHPALPDTFPRLRSLDPLTNNLPVQTTSFVGREKEVREIKALLQTTRLLTLTGAGGAGKTRLALQVAADQLEGEGDGVWMVELAPIADPNLVTQTVAQTLGVREEPGRPIAQSLIDYLRPRTLLLLLDNCEHMLAAVAPLADSILRACSGVQILASSRESLNIPGETIYRVPSLSLPALRTPIPSPESLSQYEAVRLFIERTQAAQPTFTVNQQNAPAVAQICWRLDGIPLALELAAARIRALSVEQISARLDDRFRLLTGGSRTALPRQQTLRAAIDWSYDLLSPDEQTLLRRLSVFSGGWTLEAAEAVVSGQWLVVGEENAPPPLSTLTTDHRPLTTNLDVLDVLDTLVSKSLVVYDEEGEQGRYRLLETVRQYARERLQDSGEATGCRHAHARFYGELAEQAKAGSRGKDLLYWYTRLEEEHDNLRATLDWWTAERSEEGLRLATYLGRFWQVRGYLSEGLERSVRLLEELASAQTATRGHALLAAGHLARAVGQRERLPGLYSEAEAIFRTLNDKYGLAGTLQGLGQAAEEMGDVETAEPLMQEALALYRELGNRDAVASMISNLGHLSLVRGDRATAAERYAETVALRRETSNIIGLTVALGNLGLCLLGSGEIDNARPYLRECLDLCVELNERFVPPFLLDNLANRIIHAAAPLTEEDARTATQLLAAGETLRQASGAKPLPREREHRAERLTKLEACLGTEAFARAWQEGGTLSWEILALDVLERLS